MAVIPIVLVGLLTRVYIQRSAQRVLENDNQATACAIATSTEAHLKAPATLMRQAAAFLEHAPLQPAERAQFLRSLLAASDSLEAVLLVNDRGVIQDAAARKGLLADPSDLLRLDLSAHPAFLQTRAATQPVWSPVTRSPWTGHKAVTLCQRIGDQSLWCVLSVDALENALRGSASGAGHLLAVLDKSGNLYFQSGAKTDSLPADLRHSDVLTRGRLGQPLTDHTFIEGDDCITSVAPVPSTSWLIVVATSANMASAAVRRVDLLFACLAIGSFILVAATAMILAGRLARPLQTLGDAAASVAAGSYELPLPPQQYREIEELAHSFREMASSIRRREDKLLSTQKTLNFAARGTAQGTGHAFFSDLVNVLASTTGAHCILVTEWTSSAKPRARVIAARTSFRLDPDFTYELSGNPCAILKDRAICHIPTGVSREFSESPVLRLLGAEGYIGIPLVLGDGRVGGHIAIIDDHDLPLDEQLRNLLLVLAARGGAELERIQTDRLLKQSEAQYRSIVQDQQELICLSTIDGTLTFANDAYCRYFNTTREQLVGRSFLSRLDEADRELVQAHFARLNAEHPCETIEYRVLAPDGEVRWQNWTNRVILDAKGRIVEYQGTGRDVTEQHIIETALAESEERFRQLAENINSVFWLNDWTTHKVLYVSQAFESVWGVSPAILEENPMAWSISIHEDDRARVARNFLLHAAEGQYAEEYRITRPDGSERWIRDRRFPIRNSEGQVYRLAGLAEDITEQKDAQRLLEEAKLAAEQTNNAKDQFFSALSHELRTPLTPVLLSTSVLEADESLAPEVRSELAIIRTHVEAEARLIDDLLDLTRIAANKFPLNARPTEIHGVIRAAVSLCQSDLQSKPMRITLDLAAAESCANCDPGRIQQVFSHVLKNAVKFTPAGGTIHIATANVPSSDPAAPQLQITISDTGVGMDAAMQSRLFRAFEQSTLVKGSSGGLGLGLAISQALINLHRGTIKAHSEGLGKGTCVTITLPALAAVPSTPPTVPPRSAPDPQHLRILVVEDHLSTARAVQRLLRQLGHSVFWAEGVEDALQAIRQHEFDLLLSDMGLPDGSGRDLIGPFRERFNRPGIVISGFGTQQDIQTSLDAGFSAHLVKPLDVQRLRSTVLLVSMQNLQPTSPAAPASGSEAAHSGPRP